MQLQRTWQIKGVHHIKLKVMSRTSAITSMMNKDLASSEQTCTQLHATRMHSLILMLQDCTFRTCVHALTYAQMRLCFSNAASSTVPRTAVTGPPAHRREQRQQRQRRPSGAPWRRQRRRWQQPRPHAGRQRCGHSRSRCRCVLCTPGAIALRRVHSDSGVSTASLQFTTQLCLL